MKESAIRVGIIGLGYWGQHLFRNLMEMRCLVCACDTQEARVQEYRTRYPQISVSSSVEDVLHDPRIEAVVISTPAATHADLACRAMNAGKDVFVEKPLALRVDDGETVLACARSTGRILMVGHLLQYHPAVERLQSIVREGQLGTIRYLMSNRLNLGRLRTEENVLWSFAPHDVSVMLSLVGQEPCSIWATGESYVTPGIYDTTLVTCRFDGAIQAHIYVSWLYPYKEQRLVVVGSDAMAVFDDCANEKLRLYRHRVSALEEAAPTVYRAPYETIACPPTEPLRCEMEHFVECVAYRSTPRTDGAEGLRVLRVLERAQRAIASTSTHMSLSEYVT